MQVIVFDPQYDSYACMTRRAGGVVKLVKLNDTDWSVPRDEFRAAFGPRTKMVLVNTPHNPTGTVPRHVHTASGAALGLGTV